MDDWQIEVDGVQCHVTTERTPNGKIAVRVNGRIAAPLQVPENVDCVVSAGKRHFHVSGPEESLRIEPLEPAAPAPLAAAGTPFDPIQLRVVVFIVAGLILFVFAIVKAASLRPALSFGQLVVMSQQSPAAANLFAIHALMKFGWIVVACLGLAAIGGALMLHARMRSAIFILDGVSWGLAAAAALILFAIDLRAHQYVETVYAPPTRWLHDVHVISFGVLFIFGVMAGILSSVLDRKRMLLLLD